MRFRLGNAARLCFWTWCDFQHHSRCGWRCFHFFSGDMLSAMMAIDEAGQPGQSQEGYHKLSTLSIDENWYLAVYMHMSHVHVKCQCAQTVDLELLAVLQLEKIPETVGWTGFPVHSQWRSGYIVVIVELRLCDQQVWPMYPSHWTGQPTKYEWSWKRLKSKNENKKVARENPRSGL